jgi:hypothetical protein
MQNRKLVHKSQNIFPSAEAFRRPWLFFGTFFSPEKKVHKPPPSHSIAWSTFVEKTLLLSQKRFCVSNSIEKIVCLRCRFDADLVVAGLEIVNIGVQLLVELNIGILVIA